MGYQEKIQSGNLAALTMPERAEYYEAVCQSVGLNPLTRPFEFTEFDKRVILYARKDCSDQLRSLRRVSVEILSAREEGGLYIVTAKATLPDGRCDEDTGAVSLEKEDGEWKETKDGKRYFSGNGTFSPLRGDARANAIMKAGTKAKRRVTLSICGLGITEETELDTIPAVVLPAESIDRETGEILPPAAPTKPRENRPSPPAKPPEAPPVPVDGEDKRIAPLAQALHVRLAAEKIDESLFGYFLASRMLIGIPNDGKFHFSKMGFAKIKDILADFAPWAEGAREFGETWQLNEQQVEEELPF